MIDSKMKLKTVFSFPPFARKHSRIIDENVQTTLDCYTAIFTTNSVKRSHRVIIRRAYAEFWGHTFVIKCKTLEWVNHISVFEIDWCRWRLSGISYSLSTLATIVAAEILSPKTPTVAVFGDSVHRALHSPCTLKKTVGVKMHVHAFFSN